MAASRNFSPEELEFFHNDYLNPLILNALNNSKPLIISDHKNNQILLQLSKKEIHIKSMALIPLLATNRAIGLIYMDNRLLKEIFSRQNMTIMSAIATQLSLAFKTSMLSKQLESFKSSFQEISSYSMPNEGIVSTFPQIIGKSKAINDVLYNAKKVAATNATVLIYGETGVGKELIAHILHFLHG